MKLRFSVASCLTLIGLIAMVLAVARLPIQDEIDRRNYYTGQREYVALASGHETPPALDITTKHVRRLNPEQQRLFIATLQRAYRERRPPNYTKVTNEHDLSVSYRASPTVGELHATVSFQRGCQFDVLVQQSADDYITCHNGDYWDDTDSISWSCDLDAKQRERWVELLDELGN